MDANELTSWLSRLTAGLRPGKGATEADLHAARVDLARALRAGQNPGTITSTISKEGPARALPVTADLERVVAESAAASPALAWIRSGPDLWPLDPALPDWAHGLARSTSRGPFLDRAGRPHWIDLFPLIVPVEITRGPGASPFLLVPVQSGPGNTLRRLILGKGSVWFVAQLLAPTSPAADFAGLRILQGTIEFDADVTVQNKVVQMPAGSTCTLKVQLDSPLPSAQGSASGPGADASRMSITLPDSVTMVFQPAGALVSAMGDLSATIYQTAIDLQRNASPPGFDGATRALLIPCDCSLPQFAVGHCESTLFDLGGTASISQAAWAIPVTASAPGQLGQASGAGAVLLELADGLRAQWPGLLGPQDLRTSGLYAVPGTLFVRGHIATGHHTLNYQLWGDAKKCGLSFLTRAPSDLLFRSQAGQEGLVQEGAALISIDRPVRADGSRLGLSSGPGAILAMMDDSTGRRLILFAAPAADDSTLLPLALENALLLVQSPTGLTLDGHLQDQTVASGSLSLIFQLAGVLPTLPDPYAARVEMLSGLDNHELGQLVATVTWTAPDSPQLSFSADLANLNVDSAVAGLLDVSSNANQFGVALGIADTSELRLDGMSLLASGGAMRVFTVPPISWEPMVENPASMQPDDLPVPLPDSEGEPPIIGVPTVKLVPVSPAPVVELFVEEVAAGADLDATFSLPFGLSARVHASGLVASNGRFDIVQPVFAGTPTFTGGIQLELRPPNWQAPNAAFPGSTQTSPQVGTLPFPPGVDPGYGADVLGKAVAAPFVQRFGRVNSQTASVPVRRYDLSGYGASGVSDWSDPGNPNVTIIKARFDVFVGRTGYEVVITQSYLYPWAARVVRSVTMQRQEEGWVERTDSGWQAASTGEFQFPEKPGNHEFNTDTVHPGAVLGVVNIRNIRPQPVNPVDVVAAGHHIYFQPVLFDADVKLHGEIQNMVTGQGQLVPTRDLTGYVQMFRDNGDTTPATLAEVAGLLQATGPVGGPIAVSVDVAGSGVTVKATGVDVSTVEAAGLTAIVAALRGTPRLPRDGAWSLARQFANGTPPEPLDPNFPVPLVQSAKAVDHIWHFADPRDILPGAVPLVDYALLQGTGTQKTYFARPQVTRNVQAFGFPNPPRLADVGSLLNATGVFPQLDKVLAFPAAFALQTLGEGDLTFTPPPFKVAGVDPTTLIGFGPVKLMLAYHDGNPAHPTEVTVTTNPATDPRWSVTMKQVCLMLQTPLSSDPNDPILSVTGTIRAAAGTAPTMDELAVNYGSFLKPVKDVFAKLQEVAQYLPGGKAAGLAVGFSAGKLTIRDSFALPKLPLGVGSVEDVALDLGADIQLGPPSLAFTAGIGSVEKPFHWLVSPLSGSGVVQVGVRDAKPTFLIQAGIGAGLSIDVGIASGAASVVIAFQVDDQETPLDLRIILTASASVDVLDGLASVSLTLSAGLGMTTDPFPPNPPDLPDAIILSGSVSVAIHISVCWVADVDFDGYWQFTQRLKSPIHDVL